MAKKQEKAKIGDLVKSLTGEIPLAQERLDNEYLACCTAFEPAFAAVRGTGFEDLVRGGAPMHTVISEVSTEVNIRCSYSRQSSFGIEVDVLNLGFERRFAYSTFSRSTLQVTVQRVPLQTHED